MPKFRCVSSAKPVRTLWVSSAWRCVVRLFVQNAVKLTETRQHSGTIFLVDQLREGRTVTKLKVHNEPFRPPMGTSMRRSWRG